MGPPPLPDALWGERPHLESSPPERKAIFRLGLGAGKASGCSPAGGVSGEMHTTEDKTVPFPEVGGGSVTWLHTHPWGRRGVEVCK